MAEIRDKCLRVRAKDRDATHELIRRARSFKEYTDQEGAWNVIARGTLDAGAAFRAAHRPIVEAMFEAARADGRHESYEAYAFDAFIELARRAANATTADGTAATTEDPTTSEPGTEPVPAKERPAPARNLGIIRIDHAALRRGSVEGDAILKLVITKGVDVANVTHLGRSATVAQRVALVAIGRLHGVGLPPHPTPPKRSPLRVVKTKRTRLDELDPLCKHHHDLKTRNNWAIVEGEGARPMVPPHDHRHPNYKPPL